MDVPQSIPVLKKSIPVHIESIPVQTESLSVQMESIPVHTQSVPVLEVSQSISVHMEAPQSISVLVEEEGFGGPEESGSAGPPSPGPPLVEPALTLTPAEGSEGGPEEEGSEEGPGEEVCVEWGRVGGALRALLPPLGGAAWRTSLGPGLTLDEAVFELRKAAALQVRSPRVRSPSPR